MKETVGESYRVSMRIQELNNNLQNQNVKIQYSYDIVMHENNKLKEMNKEIADRLENRKNEIKMLYKEIRDREQGKARLEATRSKDADAEKRSLERMRRCGRDFSEISTGQAEREAQNRRSVRNQSRGELENDGKQYGYMDQTRKRNHQGIEREIKKEKSQSPEFKLNNSDFFATEEEDKEKEVEKRLTKKQKQILSKVSQRDGKYIFTFNPFHGVGRRTIYSSQEIPCLFHKKQGKSAQECVLARMHCLAHSNERLLEYQTGKCPICKAEGSSYS